jgi:hypothetical protein
MAGSDFRLASRFPGRAFRLFLGGDLGRFLCGPALDLFCGRLLSGPFRGSALGCADIPGSAYRTSGRLALCQLRVIELGAVAFHRLLPRFGGGFLPIGYGWRSQIRVPLDHHAVNAVLGPSAARRCC